MIALTVGFDHRYQQEEIVQEVAAKIAAAIGLLPAIGVGTIVNELTAINESYIEGLAALDYHVSNNQQIIYYLEISAEEQRSAIQYPDSQKLKLIQALNQGNSDIAIETVHWLIKDGLSKQRSQPVQKDVWLLFIEYGCTNGRRISGRGDFAICSRTCRFYHSDAARNGVATIGPAYLRKSEGSTTKSRIGVE